MASFGANSGKTLPCVIPGDPSVNVRLSHFSPGARAPSTEKLATTRGDPCDLQHTWGFSDQSPHQLNPMLIGRVRKYQQEGIRPTHLALVPSFNLIRCPL